MDKIKSLLLPLALVFAGIAVFETGVRYGATNMRAHAIAEQLQISLQIAARGETIENAPLRATYGTLIDNGIAAGALHRQIWHLDKKAKAALNQTLAYALAIRGPDNIIKNFELAKEHKASDQKPNSPRLDEIIEALRDAKVDLIDNAPKPEATAPAAE